MSPRDERDCIAEGHWTTEHDPDRGEITVHDPDEGPCEFAAPSAGTDTPEPCCGITAYGCGILQRKGDACCDRCVHDRCAICGADLVEDEEGTCGPCSADLMSEVATLIARTLAAAPPPEAPAREVLDDLRERLAEKADLLLTAADEALGVRRGDRLEAKADSVRLALSFVDEALRLVSGEDTQGDERGGR